MRYLCLLVGEPDMDDPVPGTPEFMQMLSDYQSATQAMTGAGVLVDSGPLQPASAATTIRVRGGEPLVTDGPFAELKEHIETSLRALSRGWADFLCAGWGRGRE
jgi:hypothetical protein